MADINLVIQPNLAPIKVSLSQTVKPISVKMISHEGKPGVPVVISTTPTHIVWKYADEDDSLFRNIISFDELSGNSSYMPAVASENISAGRVVTVLDGSASYSQLTEDGSPTGLSTQSALVGEIVLVQLSGGR